MFCFTYHPLTYNVLKCVEDKKKYLKKVNRIKEIVRNYGYSILGKTIERINKKERLQKNKTVRIQEKIFRSNNV